MELTVREQIIAWGCAALFALLMLWLLGDVILPFLLGGALAYFLDPAADRLEELGLSRAMATVVISLVAVLFFVAMVLLVVPTMVEQAVAFVDAVPTALPRAEAYISRNYPEVFDEQSFVRQSLNTLAEAVQSRASDLTNTVLASAMGVINFIILLVIVPVVAFYMLLDWDRMIAKVRSLLPREHSPTIYRLAEEIDEVLAGFVRGQLTVCLILGAFYGVTLMLVGLNYGLIVGMIAGLLAFIPYVGTFIGGVLSIGIAVFQFWEQPQYIFLVIGVFVFGQFVEGNFLSPKLVGSSVGLHPVWLIFALSAFGALFGFVGMLVAVPVAAALGVLARFGVERYKDSRFYRGTPPKLDVDSL